MKNLSLRTIGKLLRLAELAERERNEKPHQTVAAALDEIRHEVFEKTNGIYEQHSAERDLKLALESLTDEGKRDVIGWFYYGRHDGDDFEALRHAPVHPAHMPKHIGEKLNLHRCLIEGLKRFGDESAAQRADSPTRNFAP